MLVGVGLLGYQLLVFSGSDRNGIGEVFIVFFIDLVLSTVFFVGC